MYRINLNNSVNIIVAINMLGGIGNKGKLPWHDKEDLQHFKELTTNNICIMGRRTYEEIYEKFKYKEKDNKKALIPKEGFALLPNRTSYVITSQHKELPGVTCFNKLRIALQNIKEDDSREIFIIGGRRLFVESLVWTKRIYYTLMKNRIFCDTKLNMYKYIQDHFSVDKDNIQDFEDKSYLIFNRIK